MAITQLGKELKVIRIHHDLNRAQMAKALKINDRELAAIELGKADATDDLLCQIANIYTPEDEFFIQRLREAHLNSINSVAFQMRDLSSDQRFRVAKLKADIEFENKLEMEKAAELKKAMKGEKAAARRASKKSPASSKASEPSQEESQEYLLMQESLAA